VTSPNTNTNTNTKKRRPKKEGCTKADYKQNSAENSIPNDSLANRNSKLYAPLGNRITVSL
jgi:hypothetical protein